MNAIVYGVIVGIASLGVMLSGDWLLRKIKGKVPSVVYMVATACMCLGGVFLWASANRWLIFGGYIEKGDRTALVVWALFFCSGLIKMGLRNIRENAKKA
jgi:hypothetical protein